MASTEVAVSLLFDLRRAPYPRVAPEGAPQFFADLHLDQLVAAAVANRKEHGLEPLFWHPLHDRAAVLYRQEVVRDLEKPAVAKCVGAFADNMRRARSFLRGMGTLHGRHYQQGWFLDAAESYCRAVRTLQEGMGQLPLEAQAFALFRDHLDRYSASPGFASLVEEVRGLRSDLASVRYSLLIKGTRVTVGYYRGEPPYSEEIEEVFARFRQGAAKDFRARFPDLRDANHVHALVLEGLAKLYPKIFSRLEAFFGQHKSFTDPTVASFDREAQFYLAYLDLIEPLRDAGMPFSYPEIRPRCNGAEVEGGFDIVLALKDRASPASVVRNDARLEGPERALVVTGPNQGGKTTFARMFAQVHYLASLGLPVPASRASLGLPDRVFTHFERQERLENLSGKLEDELLRARQVLSEASAESVVVMNESFSSTTVADALFIGTRVLEKLLEVGALVVYVTFIDELSQLSEATVSMVAEVLPEDPSVRTFKLTRRPADGRAYAMALARKHGLAYDQLRRRVAR